MDIQTDRALVPAGAPSVRSCTVPITPPTPAPAGEAGDKAARPVASVALVIDRSGSMAGSKIGMAKKAVTHAMRLLHERDRLAVVCYDHDVDVLLAASPAGAEAKTLAASRLRALDARGNTDLSAGWRAGAEQVGVQLPAKVMLLTDGLANQGETD